MADLAGKIESARAKVNAKTSRMFPDLFTLIVPGATVPDGFGGETQTAPTEYKNIPGKVEVLTRSDQIIGGGQITTQSHKLTMGTTAITQQIAPHYQIVRQSHHNQVAQTFENPVPLIGSFDVFMKVAATLKR